MLVPVDRPHWIFRERTGSKKVRRIGLRGDLRYIDLFMQRYVVNGAVA